MAATQTALDQLDTLLGQLDDLREVAQHDDLSDRDAEVRILVTRLQSAIDRLTVPTSAHARATEQIRDHDQPAYMLRVLVGIATALRDDIAAGWLTSVVEFAHADTYAGYLEKAEGLSGQGYKDPAAVIAGTSLEVHLKALATKHGISLQLPSGVPKKMNAVNAELKAAGVYNAQEHQQILAWLAIRNAAAHGNYGDYDDTAVKTMVEGIGGFAGKYPA